MSKKSRGALSSSSTSIKPGAMCGLELPLENLRAHRQAEEEVAVDALEVAIDVFL